MTDVPEATDRHSEYVILIAFFSTTTIVTRTRLIVTLYVHCLCCHILKGSLDRVKLYFGLKS